MSVAARAQRDAKPGLAVGQRVIALVNHLPDMKGKHGSVASARSGTPPYYGVRFDGETSTYKYLSEDEIACEPKGMSDAARRARNGQPRIKGIDFKAGKATRYQAFDVLAFDVTDASQRRMTPEGFMVVPANISRTGIQEYSAMELGLEGTNRTVRLLRPADEVFKPESYSTFERQTLTNNHPDGEVTSENYCCVTIGDVHDVAPADATNLGANLYFKAQDAIETVVQWGKNQLSCGYSFVLDMTPGTTADDQGYDGVMRDIKGNHVALVWEARGGPNLRVADQDTKKRKKTMKTITINSIKFEVGDETPDASIALAEREIGAITSARDAATKRATDAEAATKEQGEAMKKLAADHKAALDAVEAKVLKPEQLATLVGELSAVAADAAKVLPEYDAKGKTAGEIRIEVLASVLAEDGALKATVTKILGGVEPSKATDVRVLAAFDTVVATSGTTDADGEHEREIADAIVGDKSKAGAVGKPQKLAGRALLVARSGGLVGRDTQRQ